MTTTALAESWITATGIEGGGEGSRDNPLKDYTILKVYNPNMGAIPDIEMDGQIVKLTDDGWIPFAKELKSIKVISLTKCYKGYATKLEDGKPMQDDNGKAITELYYTPEVSVYDKANIAIAKSTSNGPVVLGKGGFKSYIEFTTAMQLKDGTLNPLFSTIGTNSQTGEKYPISIMRQEYFMYFEMEGIFYKIRLGASYGRWKDVQPGTFLDVKEQGIKAFKESYPTMRFEHYYLTLDAKVEAADKYKFLSWTFKSITEVSIIDSLKKTTDAIDAYNTQGFPGIAPSNGLEALPFNMNRLAIEAPIKEAVGDEISISDIPFN